MSRDMKAAAIFFLFIAISPVSTQEIRLRPSAHYIFPLANEAINQTVLYGPGFGVSLFLDLPLFGFFAPYIGSEISFITNTNLSDPLVLMNGGAGLGFFTHPIPRLKLGISGGGGLYLGSLQEISVGNLFWRAGAEAGYRIFPDMTISATASYSYYNQKTESLFQGLSVSLLLDLGLSLNAKTPGRIISTSIDSTPIFPIVSGGYSASPFGSIVFRNDEDAEIRNVAFRFQAKGYTSAAITCFTLPYLEKGDSVTVPLLAAFGEQVLALTETTRLRGEMLITYELLDAPRSATEEISIQAMHRNSMTWGDPRILASFASPNDPALLDLSKFLAGIIRDKARVEIDSNLQYAIGLFEGIRLSGVVWSPDPQTPYAKTKATPGAVDYVQYPHQSLAYRSGDSDDLAALYAAALESVGIPAALIPLENEVMVAFRMSGNEAGVRSAFSGAGDFMFVNGAAWAPVRMTLLREGFLRAWADGVRIVRESADASTAFFALSDAWPQFPPVGIPNVETGLPKPRVEHVRVAFDSTMDLVIAREVQPRSERLRASFAPGTGTGRQRNALGVLYARYGLYSEARVEFEAASTLGFVGASVNIANVAFLTGDFEKASEWFQKVIALDDRDPAALIGLARTLYELDRYAEADSLFRRAITVKPDLALRYGYLTASLATAQAARASVANERLGDMVWNE